MSLKKQELTMDYHFNEEEIRLLALLFRKNQNMLPDGIIDFASKIERTIYNSMSIDEAAAFYS
ncbi:MAG: hypothetical protein K5873_05165 [Treponema sp.]|nr:hypothetical protein [Treponema sp.]